MTDTGTGNNEVISFGPFRVDRARRLVEQDGAPIQLGSRAFDILALLLEQAGQVVGKEELLRKVWPNSFVEEGSLRFHITALRKALGEARYVTNIAGQGYSFVAPVSRLPAEPSPKVKSPARPLPPRPHRLLGRDQVLRTLAQQILEHRFVTVVGPGGVGKTSVALTLAHDLALQFDGDTCFFDVGSVFNPELLAGGLASALGIPKQPAGAAPSIVTFLQRRRMLLVLDGCESEVDAVAVLAEQMFRETSHIHLLVTSREALRADGEHVHRLLPLDCPGAGAGQSAADALSFAAVEFFVERAASSLHSFVLTDEDAPLVSAICRKLDGLALAIELAAGRIGTYDVREVARQLESEFALSWPARRTAVPRHQTLSATLEWSYNLLSAREQAVFRRLSVFAGSFTLEMASALAANEELSQAEATQLLGSLVSKSLVQFNRGGARSSYRLLDMTRSYARDKLRETGEMVRTADRHARLILRLLADAGANKNENGLRRCRDILDDVGVAIEWSVSPEGNFETGAALAEASAPVWLWAGLLVECRFWMKRVLDAIGSPKLDASCELSIRAALASAETFTDGFTEASFNSWLDCFEIAKSLGNIEHQLTCLVVLWAHRIRAPHYSDALSLALQVEALTAPIPDQGIHAMADWMVGISRHHLGELTTARAHFDRSLAGDTLQARQAMLIQFGYDRRIPTLGVLSNLHWLEGRPDQALRVGAQAVSEARDLAYPVPLCEALTWQALNLHLRGDDPGEIDVLLDEAIAHARRHFIESYTGLGLALKGLNGCRTGLAGSNLVTEGLGLLSKSNYEVFHPLFLTEFARLRAQSGADLDDQEVSALIKLESDLHENWSSAEVKRNLGEILFSKGDKDQAAQLFADAADCAERQGAIAWALRTTLSRARLADDENSRHKLKTQLEGLLGRFTEGEETADFQGARLFLTAS
ncbi:MAG TPA: winged helix-turn-helix domain-containing protein [Rhizomicrobium sp.]|nr:winged helix-turn-helix domain-containing protein [Rhizomicrobium sp.]